MCRLFFSYNKINNNTTLNKSKHQLLKFFDKCDEEDIKDGYGISWFYNNSWHVYKSPLEFNKDPHILKKINQMSSNILIAHSKNINKNDVSLSHIKKQREPQNLHPIVYNDNIIMHHGDLLFETNDVLYGYQRYSEVLPQFKLHIKKLVEKINPNLVDKIKGDTDSEIILFLFLTIKMHLKNTEDINGDELIIKSFLKTIKLIEDTGFVNKSNIIFANNDYIIVAKIYKNDTKIPLDFLDLYIHKSVDNVTISSAKTFPNSINIKNNTILFFNYKKNQ